MSPGPGVCPKEDWERFRSHRQRWLDRLAADSKRHRLEAAWRLPARAAPRVSSSSSATRTPRSPSSFD